MIYLSSCSRYIRKAFLRMIPMLFSVLRMYSSSHSRSSAVTVKFKCSVKPLSRESVFFFMMLPPKVKTPEEVFWFFSYLSLHLSLSYSIYVLRVINRLQRILKGDDKNVLILKGRPTNFLGKRHKTPSLSRGHKALFGTILRFILGFP